MSDTGSVSWMQIRVPCKSCDIATCHLKMKRFYSKIIKQKFTGLEINEEGSIVLGESEEEYVAKNDEGLLEKITCQKRNLFRLFSFLAPKLCTVNLFLL